MARINIYIPDEDEGAFKKAQHAAKNAGHSISSIIVHGLKSTPFWPKGDKSKKSDKSKTEKKAAEKKSEKKADGAGKKR